MPQTRQFPQVTNVLGTDAILLDRIGSGTVWLPGADLPSASGTQQFLISASGANLIVSAFYAVKTGSGAYSMTLPQLSLQASPQYLEVFDIDNNAFTNNITINAFSGDNISDHGTLASSYVINVNNTGVRLIVNSGSWTLINVGT